MLSQSYRSLEYIVVDGGSTDDSRQILEKYKDKVSRLIVEPDQGQADAIKKGFQLATGEIFGWLNSDDVLLPGALDRVARYFERNPKVEAINGGAYVIDEYDRRLRVGRCSYTLGVRATYNRLRIYGQEGIFQCAAFWRANAYRESGGVDADLHYAMDLDLLIRLAQRRRIERLPLLLACFRRHAEAKTSRQQAVQTRELSAIRKRYASGVNPLAYTSSRRAYKLLGQMRRAMLWGLDLCGMIDFATIKPSTNE